MLLVESEMSACWREARWLICEWQANRVLSEMPIGGSRQIWNLDWLQPTLYVTDKLQNFDLDRVIISFNFYHNRNSLQWITLDCIQWHWLMCKGHWSLKCDLTKKLRLTSLFSVHMQDRCFGNGYWKRILENLPRRPLKTFWHKVFLTCQKFSTIWRGTL